MLPEQPRVGVYILDEASDVDVAGVHLVGCNVYSGDGPVLEPFLLCDFLSP